MIKEKLQETYTDLKPFSENYLVDFKRYLFTLNLIEQLDNKRGKKILDVGTGIGIIPVALNKIGIESYGTEFFVFPENNNEMFSIKNIEKLKNIWENNKTKIINAGFNDRWPWVENYFDIINSDATIEHLKDPKIFLDKCYRELKTGGYFILSTPNLTTLLKRLRFLLGRSPLWPVADLYKDGENFTGHWREYTIKELCYMCKQSGFKIVKTYNKNLLASFKNPLKIQKNFRALIALISFLFPGTREMNYIICKK